MAMDAWLQNCCHKKMQAAWLNGCMDAWMHECKAACEGCMNAMLHEGNAAGMKGSMNARLQVYKVA
jgi:hypothetical protein